MAGHAPRTKGSRARSLNRPVDYQLKITLADIQPPIWRRILVPGLLTLDQLHHVIQQLMGWINAHLHEFVIGSQRYGVPDPDAPVSTVLPDWRVRLQDVAPPPGSHFVYRYDFGDGWEIEIAVEQILAAGPHRRGSVCLDGARHGPPEDCGGPARYAELLTAVRDPSRSEHEAMRVWVGRRFDPERFDVDATNRALRKNR
jgi:pRiA4b ORF-3-like protein